MKRFLSVLLISVGLSVAYVAIAQPADPSAIEAPAEATLAPTVAPEAPAEPTLPAPVGEAPADEADATGPESAPDVPSADPAGLAYKVLDWVMSGEYSFAAVGLVMLVMIGLRWGADKWDKLAWFTTRWGGWFLNLGGSTAGAVLTGQLAGQDLSARLVLTGLLFGFAAAGGIEFFKDVKKGNKPTTANPPPTPV